MSNTFDSFFSSLRSFPFLRLPQLFPFTLPDESPWITGEFACESFFSFRMYRPSYLAFLKLGLYSRCGMKWVYLSHFDRISVLSCEAKTKRMLSLPSDTALTVLLSPLVPHLEGIPAKMMDPVVGIRIRWKKSRKNTTQWFKGRWLQVARRQLKDQTTRSALVSLPEKAFLFNCPLSLTTLWKSWFSIRIQTLVGSGPRKPGDNGRSK